MELKAKANMFFWALAVISVMVNPSTAQLEAEIDELVEAVLNCTDIPGLALTVVRDGQVHRTAEYRANP